MSHEASTGQYKYDLHVICRLDQPEPKEVEALRQHLNLQPKTYKIYGNNEHVHGRSVFDAVGEGIDQSCYTMLWVTKENVEAEPQLSLLNYFHHNVLARLADADPKPKGTERRKGTERMLIALDGISDEDFKLKHPEFKQFVTLCVHLVKDWKERIEDVLKKKGVFSCDNEQTNQRNLSDDHLRHAAEYAVCAATDLVASNSTTLVPDTDAVENYAISTHPSNDYRPTMNREDSGCSTNVSFQYSELTLSPTGESLPQAALDGTCVSYNLSGIPTPDNLPELEHMKDRIRELQGTMEEEKEQRMQLEKERALEKEQQEKERALEKEQQEKERALEKERQEKERTQVKEQLEKVNEQLSALLQQHSEATTVQVSYIVQSEDTVQCDDTYKKPADLEERSDKSNERNIGNDNDHDDNDDDGLRLTTTTTTQRRRLPAIFGFVRNVYDNVYDIFLPGWDC